MTREQSLSEMHAPWTKFLEDAMWRGPTRKEGTFKVSGQLLGRVLGRIMRGGGVNDRKSVSPVAIARADMNLVSTAVISPGSVAEAIKALQRMDLIVALEKGTGQTDGRVRPVALDGSHWSTIGIHLEANPSGPRNLYGVLTRMNGTEVVDPESLDLTGTGWDRAEEAIINAVVKLAETLLARAETGGGFDRNRLMGIGIAVGAHVDRRRHVHFDTDLNKLVPARLADPIAQALKAPVVIENTQNALALYAYYEGRFTAENAALIQVSTSGVGGALIIGGRMHRGQGGMAMEVGHLPCEPTLPRPHTTSGTATAGFAAPCTCGPKMFGHLDCLATPSRILEEIGGDDLKIAAGQDVLIEDPEQPDTFRRSPEAIAFRRAGAALGQSIAQVVNIVNPGQLILRLPTAIANAPAGQAGEEYMTALKLGLQGCYSSGLVDLLSGGANVRNGGNAVSLEKHELQIEAMDAADGPIEAAKAAAVAVMHGFVNHARSRDECDIAVVPERKQPRKDTAA